MNCSALDAAIAMKIVLENTRTISSKALFREQAVESGNLYIFIQQ